MPAPTLVAAPGRLRSGGAAGAAHDCLRQQITKPKSAGAAGTPCRWAADAPVLDRGDDTGYAPADGAARGGYILAGADCGSPSVLLIGTGSEVQVALDARDLLQSHGIPLASSQCHARNGSPRRTWPARYGSAARHPGAGQRGSGVSSRWGKIIGDAGRSVGERHYGASAGYQTLYHKSGITVAAVAAAGDSIHPAQNGTRPGGHPATFAPAAGGTADHPA
jgi:transketolase